jgi:hypothetical protein
MKRREFISLLGAAAWPLAKSETSRGASCVGHLPKLTNGPCGHSDASVYLDPHFVRQPTQGDVERCNTFGLVSHQGFRSLHEAH